jgi:hypothetical protein
MIKDVYVYLFIFLIFTLVKEGVPALLACRVVSLLYRCTPA